MHLCRRKCADILLIAADDALEGALSGFSRFAADFEGNELTGEILMHRVAGHEAGYHPLDRHLLEARLGLGDLRARGHDLRVQVGKLLLETGQGDLEPRDLLAELRGVGILRHRERRHDGRLLGGECRACLAQAGFDRLLFNGGGPALRLEIGKFADDAGGLLRERDLAGPGLVCGELVLRRPEFPAHHGDLALDEFPARSGLCSSRLEVPVDEPLGNCVDVLGRRIRRGTLRLDANDICTTHPQNSQTGLQSPDGLRSVDGNAEAVEGQLRDRPALYNLSHRIHVRIDKHLLTDAGAVRGETKRGTGPVYEDGRCRSVDPWRGETADKRRRKRNGSDGGNEPPPAQKQIDMISERGLVLHATT